MSPNPTALPALVKEQEVDHHRAVTCDNYDDCLDSALRSSWRSWSCARCQRFEASRSQFAEELRAAELHAAAFA
jgi:hypothetical protein